MVELFQSQSETGHETVCFAQQSADDLRSASFTAGLLTGNVAVQATLFMF
jgi:hypothetical protein